VSEVERIVATIAEIADLKAKVAVLEQERNAIQGWREHFERLSDERHAKNIQLREVTREIAERIRETTDAGEYIGAQFATMAVSTMREWADALDRLTEGENDG
jgi:hypothetical protein